MNPSEEEEPVGSALLARDEPLTCVASPDLPPDHPDRPDECEVLLEDAMRRLLALFQEAGWSEEEFNAALLSFAKSHAPHENL